MGLRGIRVVLYEKPSATLVTEYLQFHEAAGCGSRLPIIENWLARLSAISAKPLESRGKRRARDLRILRGKQAAPDRQRRVLQDAPFFIIIVS